ncbi:PEP-CTERM sorting domain-containing protein [Colwellia sp. MB3u-4]|uniref:PEP-CTERM sorting domain-containing protein n=1 Tax=Colwellia sp. MB3u-4 TaxID=2759822 RepID=UPI0015F6B565|nr:PEP-CTERM sorting domain-containing protein [Colwellia sp. MB3u-4]MBA6289587.1 PEP-CTERM sorting domain-containing protein [Colwellia sp. MB3u-4]
MRKILLIASLLFSVNVCATPISTLFNGGSIVVGDKLFDQWELIQDISSNPFSVNTDDIDVTSLADGGLNPGSGLHFEILNDAFTLEGNDSYTFLDFMFSFRVSVLDPIFKIKDNSLYLTDSALINPTSLTSIFIEEKIYSDPNRGNEIGTKNVERSDIFGQQNEKLFDSANFSPTDEIWVTKNILLEAGDFGEFASLRSFEQRFSQVSVVPEPSTLILFSLALVSLTLRRKSK